MGALERIVFWSLAALAVIFGSATYDILEQLRRTTERHATLLERPDIEAAVFPGVPAALRDEWMTAVGPRAKGPQPLWLTMRVANAGGEASAVTARLALLSPVLGVFAYGPNGETFTNEGGRPLLQSDGDAGAPVEVKFRELPTNKAALIFVAVRPDGFGAPPYDPEARARWTSVAPRHWREAEVRGRAGGTGEEGVLARLYGLGAPLLHS